MKNFFVAAVGAMMCAGAALAQPQITSLGSSSISFCSDDGSKVFGVAGTPSTVTRFNIGNGAITSTALTGSAAAVGISNDGSYVLGLIPNSGGLGGFPTSMNMAARWSEATGWVNLGLLVPDAGLGVVGTGNSGGDLTSPRAIAASGQFVVGQCYINQNNSFRFRGWIWDAAANGGAGQMTVLPTSFNTALNRYRDGTATAVSADGSVVVGAEDHNSSANGRALVWRRNNMGTYDMSPLPDVLDGNGNPIRHTVGSFLINDAGTVIVGTSLLSSAPTDPLVLTKWTWNEGTMTWDRTLLHGATLSVARSWYSGFAGCTLGPTVIPTSMTEDGNTILGICVQSTCGSFLRSAFIWRSTDGMFVDLQDHLTSLGTTGIATWASPGNNLPPALGNIPFVNSGGSHLCGFGNPQFSTPGPGWVFDADGGADCVPPFITTNPQATINLSRCASFILNSGAGGTTPIDTRWHKDGIPLFDGTSPSGSVITGAATTRLTITRLSGSDAGSYVCRFTGQCGTATETTATVAQVDPAIGVIANDTCDMALEVGEGTFNWNPCGLMVDDIPYASCTVASTTSDIWFKYTPTFTGEARFETCGASYDSVITVLDGCIGSELACNDDRTVGPTTGCSSTRSRIGRLAVTQGVPVWVRVSAIGSFFGTPTGQLVIMMAPPLPVNDDCNSPLTAVTGAQTYNTTEATTDGVVTCNATSGRDIWYSFVAPDNGNLTVNTCGSTFNTVLSIHDHATRGICAGNELACNDNANVTGCSSQSAINNFAMTCGQSILIRVAGSSATTFGAGTLNVAFTGTTACRCDWNNADGLDSQDFFDFIDAFFNGDADYNCVDGTDSQDYFDFLNCFFDGCD